MAAQNERNRADSKGEDNLDCSAATCLDSSVKPIPSDAYTIAAAIMAVFFVAGMVRVWLLRRVEDKLLKRTKFLETELAMKEREVSAVRQDAFAWRSEIHRQFDEHRAIISEQLAAERRRFDDLLEAARKREFEQQTALDIARQMCAELPAAKARVMHLEEALEINNGEGLTGNGNGMAVTPMPAIGDTMPAPCSNGTALNASEELGGQANEPLDAEDLQVRIAQLQQHNTSLRQALSAARLRARMRTRPTARPVLGAKPIHRPAE